MVLPEVKTIDSEAFYLVEQARDVSNVLRPVSTPLGADGIQFTSENKNLAKKFPVWNQVFMNR